MKTKYFLRTLILISAVILVILNFYFLYFDYDYIITSILEKTNKLDKIEKFQSEYFDLFKLNIIRIFLIIISGVYFFAIYKWYKITEKKVIEFLYFIYYGFQNKIVGIPKKAWLVFIIIIIAGLFLKLHYIVNYPVTNDEAFTYLNYVRHGFLVSASYYTANNHILNSLLCSISNLLPINIIYGLRIPGLISGLITLFVFFLFINEYYKSKLTLLTYTYFAFLFPVVLYGFLARGYGYIHLFTIISIYSIFKILFTNKNQNKYWAIFCISSISGFYSILIFLYPFISLCIFYIIVSIIQKKYYNLKKIIYAGILVGVGSLLLYTPIFIVNGFSSVFTNEFVSGIQYSEFIIQLPLFLHSFFKWLYCENILFIILGLIILLFCLLCIFIYKKGSTNHTFSILIISFVVTPLIIISVQHVIPFHRTFSYFSIILSFSFILAANYISEKISLKIVYRKVILYSLIIFIIAFNSIIFNKKYKEINRRGHEAYEFTKLIKDNTTIYCSDESHYYTLLNFYPILMQGKSIKLFRWDFSEKILYDYIVEIKKKNEDLHLLSNFKYNLIYEDTFIRLFESKE